MNMTTEMRNNQFVMRGHGSAHWLLGLVAVLWQVETYANIVYLLIAVPFTLLYGVLSVCSFLILPAVIYQAAARDGIVSPLMIFSIILWLLVARLSLAILDRGLKVERFIAQALAEYRSPLEEGLDKFVIGIRMNLIERDYWIGIFFAVIRIPMGIANLLLVTVSFGIVFTMLSMPFLYQQSWFGLYLDIRIAHTFPGALMTMILGFPLLLIVLHGLSLLGQLQGHFTRIMLIGDNIAK